MRIGFEDTPELDLRIVVRLTAAEITALRAGLPLSFALLAAHADGVRCVLVCPDVEGALTRASRAYPGGRVLSLGADALMRLADGRGGVRVAPVTADPVPFKLVVAKQGPARASRPMPTPSASAGHRPWRRNVRTAFALSLGVVVLLAIGDVEAVSIGLVALVVAALGWVLWDMWVRPRVRPPSSSTSDEPRIGRPCDELPTPGPARRRATLTG